MKTLSSDAEKEKRNLNSLPAVRKARAYIVLAEIRKSGGFNLTDKMFDRFKRISSLSRGEVNKAIDDLSAAGYINAKPTVFGISIDLSGETINAQQ